MPSYDKQAYQTIFPQYIDVNLTPHEGRRLTRTQAVEGPELDVMAAAVRELGYKEVIVDRSISFPRSQASARYVFVPKGCIRVAIKSPQTADSAGKSTSDTQTRQVTVEGIRSKQELLRRVAAIMKRNEAERAQAAAAAPATAPVPRRK
ncbi:signal recognition particle subunit SRP19 [Trypanosoma vivax]|nr:signal recognition particle subunit SRP19 [Trypanosoma vivax]